MTEAFGDRGISCGYSPDSIRSTLYEIEEGFRKCNDILADIDIGPCSYVFQTAAIDQMVEELEILKSYAQEAPEHVYEVLDHPLYMDFKNRATESLSQIVLEDLETENIIGMEEYGKVSPTSRATKPSTQVKKSLKFRDFLDVEGLERAAGQQVLSNLDSVYEFAVLFREDYDRMKEKNIQTCIEKYLTSGEYDHKAYHPVKDFLSGLLDYTIVKPIIECCCGTDLITGERLNETEKAVKLAGAAVDLFTLGQGMIALKGSGLVGKELYKCLGKLTMVEGVSGAAAYTVGYGAGELGVPPQITWMLSVATGCTVSVAGTKIVFRDIDTGIELEYGIEELEGLGSLEGPEGWDDIRYEMYWRRILNGEDTSHPGMSDLDYALWKYGEKKVDEYIALSKVDAEELIRLRVEERIRYVGESGSGSVQTISNKFPNDNQAGKRFDYITENGRVHIENGVQNVDFVMDMDGNLHIGRGHSYLAGGSSVQAAGTMKVNSQGYIRLITNESGHFQPTTVQAMNYPTVFRNAGLNIDNAWIRIGEFETSMSNYVIDSNVLYNGPIKNMP